MAELTGIVQSVLIQLSHPTPSELVIARSAATRQSRNTRRIKALDFFASLATTSRLGWVWQPDKHGSIFIGPG